MATFCFLKIFIIKKITMKKVIDDKNLVLIYVIKIGFDYRGRALYEFLFNDTTDDVFGDEWETMPAHDHAQPPDEKYVKLVGTLKTDDIYMEVIQESDFFSVADAVDGVIALAWETDKVGDGLNENRLVFRFGETKEQVDNTLYKRDLILKYD